MADKVKPNGAEPNEYAPLNIDLHRPDQSTVSGQAGSYYGGGEPGNTVDRSRINKTVKGYDNAKTSIRPAGQPTNLGY